MLGSWGHWQPGLRRGAASLATERTVQGKKVDTEVEHTESGIRTKKILTNSLKVMVAGIKEIAMQIAIMQESFGIQDEDTEFHTMFQKGGGAKRTREEEEYNNPTVADHSGTWEPVLYRSL